MPTHPPPPTPPPPTPWARASQPHTRSRPLLLAAIRAPARGCTLVPPPPSLLPPCSSLALRRKRRGGRPRTPRALPPPCRRGRTACLFDPLPPLISTQTITRTHPSGHTSWVGAGRVGGWAGTGRVRGARGVHTQQGALPPRHPPPAQSLTVVAPGTYPPTHTRSRFHQQTTLAAMEAAPPPQQVQAEVPALRFGPSTALLIVDMQVGRVEGRVRAQPTRGGGCPRRR